MNRFKSVGLNLIMITTSLGSTCQEFQSHVLPISEEIKVRIMGKSWIPNNKVPLDDLRYITLSHWGYDGYIHTGEIIVHKDIALEVVEIFHELFAAHFCIEKMCLVDNYFKEGVDRSDVDDISMADNNSSAFFFRYVAHSDIVSEHGLGTAIDINPFTNPFIRYKGDGREVWPKDAVEFCDRSRTDVPGMITKDSVCYNIFIKHGWKWAGELPDREGKKANVQDLQHFYKKGIFPDSFYPG